MRESDHPHHLETCGIRALTRAGEAKNWFTGHLGASFLSGAELLRSPVLPDHAKGALAAALDRLESHSPDWYGPLEGPPTRTAPVDALLEALHQKIGSLRTSGHGTIYLASALRAFRRAPELATERSIAAIAALHDAAQDDDVSRYLGRADYTRHACDAPPVVDLELAVRAAFEACRQRTPDIVRDGKRYFLFGEKIHILTHLHALCVLEELGHSEMAHAGLAAHALQIVLSDVPENELQRVPEATTLQPWHAAFWETDGDDLWHKTKLAEAAIGLLTRVDEKRRDDAEAILGGMWSMLGVPTA